MARTGKDLAVDLSQLVAIGRIDLPWLACIYAEMTHAIADSADDNSAFAAPGVAGTDQVAAAWTGLRDRLHNILGGTATALEAVSAAILHVVATYEAGDAQASKVLQDAWRNGPPQLLPTEQLPPGPPSDLKMR
jgi:hypothetical protein